MLITVSPTISQIEGLTRNQLIKRLVSTGLVKTGVATSGSTTTIVDTNRLKSTQFNSKEWVGGWARISKDAGGAAAAPETEIRPIITYVPSTGTITVDPAFTAGVVVSDEYELWKIDPQIVLEIIDQALQDTLYFPCWTFLSEIPDYDMEQNNTTDWATGAGATVVKSNTEPLISGKRYLSVSSGVGGNEVSDSNVLYVEPNTTYFVSVAVRTPSNVTARLRIWDDSNGASIKDIETTKNFWHNLYATFTTPSGCKAVIIRLTSVTASSATYWDEVVLYSTESNSISLPWWVKSKSQVLGVFELSPNSLGTNIWEYEFSGELDRRWDIQDSAFGRGQLRLVSRYGTLNNPLFILGLRNETAYANDNTEKKLIDATLFSTCVAYKLYEWLANQSGSGSFNLADIRALYAKYRDEYSTLSREYLEVLRDIIQSPEPWVSFNGDNQRWQI